MSAIESISRQERQSRRQELRDVIALSIPMVITACTRMIMDVTDYAMVSQMPDSAARAALLPAQMILWTYIVIGMGTVSIVATFAAQCLGKKRHADCSAYAWQSVHLSVLFGAAAWLVWPLLRRVIALIDHDPAVQAAELAYCNAAIWSIGPTIAAAGLSSFFNGVHRPMVTMWSSLEGIAMNFVVSYCLIFGAFGFPELGIAGAAWGTVVATTYRTVRLTITMCLPHYHRQYASRSTWRIDGPKMLGVLRFGVPQGAQWCSDVMVWAIFVSVLVGRFFGTEHLEATNAVWQYLRISCLPTFGLGMAVSALVGKTIGAGEPERAMRITRISVLLAMAYMGSLAVIYFIWRWELIGFFNDNPAVIAIAAPLMICSVVFQLFDAAGITYHSALRGAGDTLWASIMFVMTHWLIVVGGGYFVAVWWPSLGSLGPWIAASGLIILCSLLLGVRWHSLAWMKIDLFKHDQDEAASGRRLEETRDQAALEPVSSLT